MEFNDLKSVILEVIIRATANYFSGLALKVTDKLTAAKNSADKKRAKTSRKRQTKPKGKGARR